MSESLESVGKKVITYFNLLSYSFKVLFDMLVMSPTLTPHWDDSFSRWVANYIFTPDPFKVDL